MSFYFNLCSSSSGNATYLGDLEGGILFDAGIGIRSCKRLLESAGVSPERVKAIFLTHEHSDHVKGLEPLSTRYHIPVYGSDGTLRSLLDSGRISGTQELRVLDGKVELDGYEILPFPTSHDSPGSVGYRIHTPDGVSAAVCTDLGYVSAEVLEGISGCDFVMLESNYDEVMLKNGPYPYFLKQRIAGRKGHLSNLQCAETLEKLIRSGATQIRLAHLSEHNNLPELAFRTVEEYLSDCGLLLNRDYRMDVLPKVSDGKVTVLAC
ncbi:MAG: MBL fold metallo-hydrolase [Oscillospiraceae bacterium]|nr:MBL fold metallo-hydrolase [Oscillospiraceae bacterium]